MVRSIFLYYYFLWSDRYFSQDRRSLFPWWSAISISLFWKSVILIWVIKFARSRAHLLCHLPVDSLHGLPCVHTYEHTSHIALHARLHVWFYRVDKTLEERCNCFINVKKRKTWLVSTSKWWGFQIVCLYVNKKTLAV